MIEPDQAKLLIVDSTALEIEVLRQYHVILFISRNRYKV